MTRIIFCLPGAPTLHNAMSWDEMRNAMGERGIEPTIIRGYNSSVAHARNELLEVGVKGLKKDAKPFGGREYDFMMWIDSDSVYTPEDVWKLLDLNVDIATGLVPIDMSGRGALGVFNDLKQVGYLNIASVPKIDKPFEVDFCGFAFLLIKRGVFEALEYPWFDVVSFSVDDHVILPGEDFGWCIKVKRKGFKIVAHPGVRIGHEKRVIIDASGPLDKEA